MAQTQFCSHAINLTDTHAELKALLQCSLKHATGGMRSLLALFREKGSCLSTQFRWMSTSPIL